MSTSTRTIKWIENLADQELLIRAGELGSIDLCTTKDQVLIVETTTFVRDLFYHFEYLTKLFNSRVNRPDLQMRLLRSETFDQFSLTRHEMRMSLSMRQPGAVQLQCDKLVGPEGPGKSTKVSFMFSGMVEAKFGTFHDVEWFFLGSRVTAEQVARHYLTEFIQATRSTDS